MTKQQEFKFGTPAHKLVRRTDPDTSYDAAETVDTTKLETLVYQAVKSFGAAGCIADDVVEMYPQHGVQTLTPRFRPLLAKGLIEDTGERRVGRCRRKQRVVRAVQRP